MLIRSTDLFLVQRKDIGGKLNQGRHMLNAKGLAAIAANSAAKLLLLVESQFRAAFQLSNSLMQSPCEGSRTTSGQNIRKLVEVEVSSKPLMKQLTSVGFAIAANLALFLWVALNSPL